MAIRSYRDLIAWQKSMELVREVYLQTQRWPKDELYGLTSQIRRAVVSIPSNIAEGHGRKSDKEFSHHLSIAYGSLMETETQIVIAHDLGYISPDDLKAVLARTEEVGRIINGLFHAASPQQ